MNLDVDEKRRCIKVTGKLDTNSCLDLDKALTDLPENGRDIIIDLSDCQYISSAGIRILLKATKRMQAVQNRLFLVAVVPEVFHVFEMAGLLNVFHLESSVEAAQVAGLGSGRKSSETIEVALGGHHYLYKKTGEAKRPGHLGLGREILSYRELGFAAGFGSHTDTPGDNVETTDFFLTLGHCSGFVPFDPAAEPDFRITSDPVRAALLVSEALMFGSSPTGILIPTLPATGMTEENFSTPTPVSQKTAMPGNEDRSLTLTSTGTVMPGEIFGLVRHLKKETLEPESVILLVVANLRNEAPALSVILVNDEDVRKLTDQHGMVRFKAAAGDNLLGITFALSALNFSLQDHSLHEILQMHLNFENILSVAPLDLSGSIENPVIWVFQACGFVEGKTQRLGIELARGTVFGPRNEFLTRLLFTDSRNLQINTLHGGYSAQTFQVESFDQDGRRMRPTVLKIGSRSLITRESERCQKYALPYIFNNSAVVLGAEFLGETGALRYNFVGIGGESSQLKWLTHYYLTSELSFLEPLFDKVFLRILKPWYGQPVKKWIYPFKDHDPTFTFFPHIYTTVQDLFSISADEPSIRMPQLDQPVLNPYWFLKHEYARRRDQGLEYFTGICHGDLNMQNILLDENMNVYLIDFSETRPRSVVSDFARLEAIFMVDNAPVEDVGDMDDYIRFITEFYKTDRLDEVPEIRYTGRHAETVRKNAALTLKMRKYAFDSTHGTPDMAPYCISLLEWVLPIVCYGSFPEIKKPLSTILSSILCQKVMAFLCLFLIVVAGFLPTEVQGQTFDTISNWDGITQNWTVAAGGYQVVDNPQPGGINVSAHCMKVVSSTDPYDLMFYNMTSNADFDQFPKYRLKILAPPGGGKVTLKFENSTNTEWQEIVKNSVPGQWTELKYDFSGLPYNSLSKMVIFIDFQGTKAGNSWYIDDIVKEIPPPLQLHSDLPIVVINTFGVSIPDDPKIRGHMGIIDNGQNSLNTLGDPFNGYDNYIGIEVRGNSSQMFPKKSYGFKTRDSLGENIDVSLLGFPKEDDWVLYASYSDKSFLRNPVTFQMARRLGSYHSRSRFCELIVNNDYKGLYVLMEKIKRDKDRVDIASLNPDEITGDDLTGGYILRVDRVENGFVYGVDGWKSDPVPSYPNAKDITFQFYYPESKDIVKQQRDYIRNFITNAENTLTRTGFTSPYEGFQKYFDTPSFVDFMLINEISKEVDKYRYSQYFYKAKDSDGGKLFAGPVWDFDLGYGNVDYWSPGINPAGWRYSLVEAVDYGIMFWWKRLNEDPYFRDLAKTRWVDLRKNILSDASFSAIVDSIVGRTVASRDRNFTRWPILGTYVWPNYNWRYNDYDDEVAYFENFLFQRLHWMDANMPGKVLQPWASISAEENRIRLKLIADYFCRPVLKPGDFRLNDAPDGMSVTSVEFVNAAECLLTLSSSVQGHPDISVTTFEQVLNSYYDLTSNKLSATGIEEQPGLPAISIFCEHRQVRIQCEEPEKLPGKVEVCNLTGQNLGSFTLERIPENVISPHLAPGIYFLIFQTVPSPVVKKLMMLN